ncbi:MAG: hypothetical protein ACK4FB_07905 [Brevundimonas sp.]|uniref:hypothetical protein n=1 Tax=Brevundimonas sp. TaxID=1871086 RepID=UPI00391BC038
MSLSWTQREILAAAQAIKREENRKRRRAVKSQIPAEKRHRGQEKDKGFLQYLRRQPCEAQGFGFCGGPVQAAHVSYQQHGIPNSFGRGVKNHDRHANPLCAEHHKIQHDMGNERRFWASIGKDAYETAARHYAAYQGQPK